MARVALDQLGKTYRGGCAALRGVSLEVADGELLALVGPSGSGKTTLLRLIAGLETPTSGVVRIGEREVNALPPHRREVAMVFQRPALYPHRSVRANLAFALKLRRTAVTEIARRIEEIASWMQLEPLLDRRPATLSEGEQQRVALGRALVRRPAVFLLDEPLSNLDARLRWDMRRQLHLLHRRIRATMIYVTHDQDEAMTLGQRVAVLDQGVIRQIDRPQALYDRPTDRFVAGFVGWPPMHFLDGELVGEGEQLRFRNRSLTLSLAGRASDGINAPLLARPANESWMGRPLVLGIRAEDVGLAENGLRMEVRLVERLGSVLLATLTADEWTLTARLDGSREVREGDTVNVVFDWRRAHWFDPATGLRLSAM